MESGLGSTQRYLVPLVTDSVGKTLAVHLYRTDSGPVLWLFTSHEKGFAFMAEFMSRPGERDKAVRDIAEQPGSRTGSEDLHFGEHFSAKTVPEMAPDLERWGVERLLVDPGFPGEEQRTHEPPHKS